MQVGVLRVEFRIHSPHSLKEKRAVMRSIKDRLFSHFNVSVAEVGALDKWQIGEIGIATVGNESARVRSTLDKILEHLRRNPNISLMDFESEIL